MGFDISGENPKNEKGEYFRNNVWWWRPLWTYICINCSNILDEKDQEAGCWNNGTKIVSPKADKIAKKLQETIDNGTAAKYEKEYMTNLKTMGKIDCDICAGTGKRKKVPATGAGKYKCNGCNGTGKTDPFAKSYPFSVENLQEFIEFVKNSGGFRIC